MNFDKQLQSFVATQGAPVVVRADSGKMSTVPFGSLRSQRRAAARVIRTLNRQRSGWKQAK